MDNNNNNNKPFNDAMEYLKKYIGIPDKINFKKTPVFIKIIGFFIVLFLILSLLLFIILPLF